jgi:hypothetical protein
MNKKLKITPVAMFVPCVGNRTFTLPKDEMDKVVIPHLSNTAMPVADELLTRVASLKRYNANRHYPNREVTQYTVNVPVELLQQIDAYLLLVYGTVVPVQTTPEGEDAAEDRSQGAAQQRSGSEADRD